MVDWFENFLSWDWVLAGIIPFWIMLFILPGLYELPLNSITKFSSLIQWRINVERDEELMWRGNKIILFSSIFHTEDNWHVFIKPQFVFICLCIQSLWQYLRAFIRELKQTDAAAERRRSHSNFLSIQEWMMSRAEWIHLALSPSE